MDIFYLNGYPWHVVYVERDDPILIDRTGICRIATTDPKTRSIYIWKEVQGDLFIRVLIHEIGHCALFSFDLLDDIHRMVHPAYWVEAEEFICNFLANYGLMIFNAAYEVIGDDAITYIPYEFERLIG